MIIKAPISYQLLYQNQSALSRCVQQYLYGGMYLLLTFVRRYVHLYGGMYLLLTVQYLYEGLSFLWSVQWGPFIRFEQFSQPARGGHEAGTSS